MGFIDDRSCLGCTRRSALEGAIKPGMRWEKMIAHYEGALGYYS